MSRFRPALAADDPRPVTPALVRELCAAATHPANLFAAPPARVVAEHRADEEVFWELFRGRLLDGTQTRERRRFETWCVTVIGATGECPAEPTLAVRYDAGEGRLYVTRAILCHAHETYTEAGNVILTREVTRWQRELIGTVVLGHLADAGALRDELACLLFQAVIGTSRLPLTSVETPLPGFALGQVGYCHRPTAIAAGAGPLTTTADWSRLAAEVELAEPERVKHLELLLQATPPSEIPWLAEQVSGADDILTVLRGVFNAVTLSPYTDFVPKALAFVRHLADRGTITDADRADFLAHLVRQLSRHLAAYDLVTFHHRGANYPDALLLADVLSELLPVAAGRPDLFAGAGREARLRRRAVRHGLLLRAEYAGHPVPDAPTSPGENLRVLPEPFGRVPDEQIDSPAARTRRLFDEDCLPDPGLIRPYLTDLDDPDELAELGTALFLDRPLGFAKAPGEPDQTWLASHVLFSRSVAGHRLDVLARRPDWLPDPAAVERWRGRLRALHVDGLPLRTAGPGPRPGVVSLHDTLRVADDWLFLRTTRHALCELGEQFDLRPLMDRLGAVIPPPADWRLVIPGGTDAQPTLCAYDRHLRLRLELAADMGRGHGTRGGAEFPAAGLRVLRAWGMGGAGVAEPFELSGAALVLPPVR